MDSNATIQITRLNNIVFPSRDVVMLALDKVEHLIGQFILADYRNEFGKTDTILVVGKGNGIGREYYSVISTSGFFVVNKVDDLADVSQISHGIETEVHLAHLRYPTQDDERDWYIVTLGPNNTSRIIEPIDRSRIFKNLDDNYRWFYIKETKTLKREDDFLSTYESEKNISELLNSVEKPSIEVSFDNQTNDNFYFDQLDEVIEDPIFHIVVRDFNGDDVTKECTIQINNEVIEPEEGSVHDYKYIGTFKKDTDFVIKAVYLDGIEIEKTIKFYYPAEAFYGTCQLVSGEVVIDEENIRTKLIYNDSKGIDIEYNLNRERSILIIPQDYGPYKHIFDINGLDYINNYTYIRNFTYRGQVNTYSAYYKNEPVIINDFRQKFTDEDEIITNPAWESEGDKDNYYTKSEINALLNNIDTDIIKDSITSYDRTWSSQKITQTINNLDIDVVDDSIVSQDKTWSSQKLNPIVAWVQNKMNEDIENKYTVVTSVSGASYYGDTNLDTTMRVTVTTKFNDVLVDVNSIPEGWTQQDFGTYFKEVTGGSGTSINSENFSYTTNGITITKPSTKKTISEINTAYYGLVNSNNGSAEITSQMLSSMLETGERVTSNINKIETLTNDSAETKYLWILTKNTADATQLGISLFSNNITANKSFISPMNGNIMMTNYNLYISDRSVEPGGSYQNVNITINT